jgi:hypothetical protein
MSIGDQVTSMFLGSQPEENQALKDSQNQLWKLYQQAYNVKPVWNGKAWAMPAGAIQRFNMLLPILQAQMSAAKAGQGTNAAGNDKGILGTLIGKSGGGVGEAVLNKLGGGRGFEGILDKTLNLIKGNGYDFPSSGNTPQGLNALESQPAIDPGVTGAGQWDTGKFTPIDTQDVPDWGNFDPGVAGNDFLSNFSPEDLLATGGEWGLID